MFNTTFGATAGESEWEVYGRRFGGQWKTPGPQKEAIEDRREEDEEESGVFGGFDYGEYGQYDDPENIVAFGVEFWGKNPDVVESRKEIEDAKRELIVALETRIPEQIEKKFGDVENVEVNIRERNIDWELISDEGEPEPVFFQVTYRVPDATMAVKFKDPRKSPEELQKGYEDITKFLEKEMDLDFVDSVQCWDREKDVRGFF